jgi:signal transduction histidine kinase
LIGNCGFWLRLERRNKLFGILKVNKIALPQYRSSYLNQALNIISVCALVIDNARTVRKLIDTAHLAGKAELAIEVLHNVGNVLNSINVSSSMIMERLQQSVSTRMPAVVDIMEQQHDNIGEFINSDPRGQKLPVFFSLLSKELQKERKFMQEDINRLFMNVEHIKGIIRAQQVYSRESELLERVNLSELLDEALILYEDKIKQYKIHIGKSYTDPGLVVLSKHKLLQIISNLIANAIDSLLKASIREYKIELRMKLQEDQIIIEVEDNGNGISLENINRIFNHGFTTKSNHSGFGLHSCANLSTEMGGKLTVSSDGEGKGACFRLMFPLQKNSRE